MRLARLRLRLRRPSLGFVRLGSLSRIRTDCNLAKARFSSPCFSGSLRDAHYATAPFALARLADCELSSAGAPARSPYRSPRGRSLHGLAVARSLRSLRDAHFLPTPLTLVGTPFALARLAGSELSSADAPTRSPQRSPRKLARRRVLSVRLRRPRPCFKIQRLATSAELCFAKRALRVPLVTLVVVFSAGRTLRDSLASPDYFLTDAASLRDQGRLGNRFGAIRSETQYRSRKGKVFLRYLAENAWRHRTGARSNAHLSPAPMGATPSGIRPTEKARLERVR